MRREELAEGIVCYLGDCREILPTLPRVDAVLTDPPYGMNYENWKGDAIGVLLTGMGRDGAQGLKNMRERGFLTLAQERSSCAVYGMPKAAAELGAAVEILPLERIAPRLVAAFG